MELSFVFQQLGIALGLGLLVGLQRQRVASRLAGVRTFPLVTISGTVCALLAQPYGGGIIAAGFLALAGIIVTENIAALKEGPADPGITTEIALLLMFVVGAYLIVGHREVAIALGGGVAVLLQLKGQLHGMVARLGETDLKAIMQFALLSLVILPVLPNQAYGPYAVLNPRQIWWMVVLIVGLSLGGYIAYKFLGERSGIALGGILGGLISSTATTVSYSRRTARAADTSGPAAVLIMIASTIVFLRVLLEIALVAPAFLLVACPPILVMMFVLVAVSLALWFWSPRKPNEMPSQANPSELKPALMFGALFAVVIFVAAAAKEHLGDRGLYLVAALSGLTDMDAITLSTAQLVESDRLDGNQGWKLIVLASMSNLLFKLGTIAALGHRQLLLRIFPLYALALAVGTCLLIWWPPVT